MRVILTIDTEPSIAGALGIQPDCSPLINEPVWGEVSGQSEGLGFITRTLNEYSLRASFFVETAHTQYFGTEAMRRYTDHLLTSKQDVQLHLHPAWRNFKSPIPAQKYNDNCNEMEISELTALISKGRDQIESWTGYRPLAMRTGNFSASPLVYQAMNNAGIRLSSNICIAASDYVEPSLNHAGGIHKINDIYELPATCFTDPGPVGKGHPRPAQIIACSASELTSLLERSYDKNVKTFVVVTHPFEFIKARNFRYHSMRPNRLIQRRFEKFCNFLARNKDRFEVTTFGELATELPLRTEAAPLLYGQVTKSLFRAAQNYINNRV